MEYEHLCSFLYLSFVSIVRLLSCCQRRAAVRATLYLVGGAHWEKPIHEVRDEHTCARAEQSPSNLDFLYFLLQGSVTMTRTDYYGLHSYHHASTFNRKDVALRRPASFMACLAEWIHSKIFLIPQAGWVKRFASCCRTRAKKFWVLGCEDHKD